MKPRNHPAMTRVAAALFAAHLATMTVAVQAQTAEMDCIQLKYASEVASKQALENQIPMINPSMVLSQLSCIDNILNTRVNIGIFFNIDSIINSLIGQAINRICNAVNSQWDRLMSNVNSQLNLTGVNRIQFPYGSGGINIGFGQGSSAPPPPQEPSSLPLPKLSAYSDGPTLAERASGIVEAVKFYWDRLWN